jgi:hypothetical protein
MNRREEDTQVYTLEWSVLIGSILTWASGFLYSLGKYSTYHDMLQPSVLFPALAQLVGTVAGLVAAKGLPRSRGKRRRR